MQVCIVLVIIHMRDAYIEPMSPIDIFLSSFQASLANESFRKLTLGKFRGHLAAWSTFMFGSVALKDGIRLSFVHRYPDHDLTQNYLVPDGVAMVRDWLGKASLAATLFTGDQRHQLLFNRHGKPRITTGPAEPVEVQDQHDREKTRLLQDETFLKHLGVLDPAGKPRTQMSDKYRQIHHFIELLAPALRNLRADNQAPGRRYGFRKRIFDVRHLRFSETGRFQSRSHGH